jgi:DNA-binding beta-propeller fold protein YncE
VAVIDLQQEVVVKEIVTGLHPGALLFSADSTQLFVACANSDIVTVIDTRREVVSDTFSVHIDKDLPFGSAPNALALPADGRTLYVANGTDNAVCVVDLQDHYRVKGLIPTAWYPGALVIDTGHSSLIVANIKGEGERNMRADQRGYNTHNPLGSLSFIPLPDGEELQAMTATVRSNNDLAAVTKCVTGGKKRKGKGAVPLLPGERSVFEHVIYIIKENRTYDQVFGDMPEGDGDTALVHFGEEVTPNHHALARQFVLLDNFYCSGAISADGHQWTDEAYVTDYLEKFFGDFPRSYPYDGDDPMAYSPTGFLWDNVLSHGLTFRNYGEYVSARIDPSDATFSEIWQDYRSGTGRIKIRARVNLPQLEPYTCPDYIGFPNKVSDQYRADVFIRELKTFEEKGEMPNLIILLLPNDHTSGTRPGRPTPRAAVADNDLALGRIVEAVSHSAFWHNTVIFVTEDDPQAGLDHVDSHRTVGLVISPYTKRGEVISTYYSQVSMFRTIENILGIPPLNRFDVAALPMSDCFTEQLDLTPYKALPSNIPLDKINPALESLSGEARYWAEKSLEQDLEDVDRIDDDTFNRILWHAIKGYDRPYPEI